MRPNARSSNARQSSPSSQALFATRPTTSPRSSTRPRQSVPSARSSASNGVSRHSALSTRSRRNSTRRSSARVTTFGAHHEDLVRAGSELRAMARGLEREIEQRFDTVFGAVSFHFQELYAELFPGGKATLRLEDPEPETLDLDRPEPRLGEAAPGCRDPRAARRQAAHTAPPPLRRRARAHGARGRAGAAAGEPKPLLCVRRGRRVARRQQRPSLHPPAPPPRHRAAVPRCHPQPHHHGRCRRALGRDHRRRGGQLRPRRPLRRSGVTGAPTAALHRVAG